MNTSRNKDRWDSLSMKEKSDMMKVAVQQGIYNLSDIRKAYNEYAEGGPENQPYTPFLNDTPMQSAMRQIQSPEARAAYWNATHPQTTNETPIVAQPDGTFRRETRNIPLNTSAEAAKTALEFTPVVGDVLYAGDVLDETRQGNYGTAAALAGLAAIPFVGSKVGKAAGKFIRKFRGKDIDFAKWTDKQWDDAYEFAIKSGNNEEAQMLRDVHFMVKAPNTAVKEGELPKTVYHGTRTSEGIKKEGFKNDMSGKANRGADNGQFYFSDNYENAAYTGMKVHEDAPFIDKIASVHDLFDSESIPTLKEIYKHADDLSTKIKSIERNIDDIKTSMPNKIRETLHLGKSKKLQSAENSLSEARTEREEAYRRARVVDHLNSGLSYLSGDRSRSQINTLHFINEPVRADSKYRQIAANEYLNAAYNTKNLKYSPDVIPVYLNMEKPLVTDFKMSRSDANPLKMPAFSKEAMEYGKKEQALLNELKKPEYDGSVSKNKFDVLFGDVYIAKSPTQIKSADAITYDNAGNIIPLSKRDNFNVNDIRYIWPTALLGGTAAASYANQQELGGPLVQLANRYEDGGPTDESNNIIDWIIGEEGFNSKPENIGDGKITLGSGLTNSKWHKIYNKKGTWTAEDNRAAVAEEVENRRRWAEQNIPNWTELPKDSQNALLSYKYNYNFTPKNSPKLFKALEDRNYEEAARQMDATSSNPRFRKGLQARRQREQEMFMRGINSMNAPEPEVVEEIPQEDSIYTPPQRVLDNMAAHNGKYMIMGNPPLVGVRNTVLDALRRLKALNLFVEGGPLVDLANKDTINIITK